ncbi:hypothetical protein EH223_14105 [candidate division KSB1 bacterium]|nr:hypothetical protein [candidate division KSB1 bacterium]RQW01824.1 MAG: hypothetical protein EH223_14105 [candidate division KSB1 bacterium]
MLFVCLVLVFILVHEMGHVITAKIFGLNIIKMGIKIVPIPHAFIIVDSTEKKFVQLLFYFSGFIVTIAVFVGLWIANLLAYKLIYYAICFQIVVDSNPFFSDFSLAFPNNYRFSTLWYVHFTLWALLIITFISLKICHSCL